MNPRCFQVNLADNVATMLDDVEAGARVQVLGDSDRVVESRGPISMGHKIALIDIGPGESVTKFGVAIGHASRAIRAGEWVHLHNLVSNFDERSQTLDLHTGAATDTKYE
jgi:altronate dehydratase small subunit